MAEVLFIVEVPTPYRNPVLDHLHLAGMDVLALYHRSDGGRGWGSATPAHPHLVVDGGRLRRIAALVRAALRPELRVVCCFGYGRLANVFSVLVARLRGARVVIRSDSNWLDERRRPRHRRWVKRLLLPAIFGRKARVWTVGAQNDRYWAEYGFTNRHVIPFGLPRPPVASLDQAAALRTRHALGDGLVILFVGRLAHAKGLDTLLAAFAAFDDRAARLVIVGQGPQRSLVDRAATADPRLRVLGALPQDQLGSVYAAADLFVLPSRYEPWGLVVAEAQANGLRVAVSDVVGCHADRVTTDNGWVFPAGDADRLAEVFVGARELKNSGRIRVPATPAFNAGAAMAADLVAQGARMGSARVRPVPDVDVDGRSSPVGATYDNERC
ncbi:glycosyltransferase family 4 protein [Micromonospora sp. NPDC006766]|uniref:glycosyltransferase family 4 protein n=1 Tax=Micromonospora sp. NPDC006766 TaxID=3154778 RepID=UPI0033D7AA22